MASISGSRSGGKMVRPRRIASTRTRTPYQRPAPSQSPNWLSRFVISPTRFIASGAGKLFSSVLDLESSPTSSSSVTSSPSSSDSDSSDEEVGTFDDENDKPFDGDVALDKPLVGNNKSKHIIEQLLMQESFSREECDRLINIIRSRIVDSPTNDGDGDKRARDTSNRTLGSVTESPDLCSAAVLEAKKWLLEKKSGLDSNSDLVYGSPTLNLVTLPQAPKDEGSPVDVAKSYMRTRPPWASPSIDHTKPPTPSGIQLFKEETPHLFGGNSTSSSKLKRDSLATEPWSIQDEIRRVRARATEEMLRTLPSSKIDWSASAMEQKHNVKISAIENIGASSDVEGHNFAKLADTTANLSRELGSEASPDLETKLDGFQTESLLSVPANINSEQNQGFVAVQQTKDTQDDCRVITASGLKDESSDDNHSDRHGDLVKVNGINDTNVSNHQPEPVEENREASNSRLQDALEQKVGAEDALANGFPSSGPSFYAGQVIEQDTKTSNDEPSATNSSRERTAKDIQQETCKLSREPMEVPHVIVEDTVASKEEDGVATGSQNSSSVQYEVQQSSSQSGLGTGLAATPTSIAKQKGKRITKYNRRGRGRGVK